ncbi:biopolymer transporter ExbD [Caulobacter soli]|uniref:biopolymer transporter ExbD n=1 Tax=Caulobacter soli TaxID=2708539 RepID=UPI0013EDD029|nr:biopolymer transporter ExbD [Caulobacter soli]
MAAKLAGNGGGGRYAIHQNADINVTPFVDVLLVLLIIFMVAVPMATTSIKLDMPPAQRLEVPIKPPVLITIQTSGGLYLAGQPTRLDTLARDVNARFTAEGWTEPRKDQRLMVSAQADVPYEALMGVIDRVHTAGWTQIGIVNEDIR